MVDDSQRSDAALEAAVGTVAAAGAGRRMGLAAADGRRGGRRVDTACGSAGAAVSRLVQLLLHHRHRDLADLEEVADRHLVGAAPAAGDAVGHRRRVAAAEALRRDAAAVLPPLEVGHRQRVNGPRAARRGRPRRLLRALPARHDRVAASERADRRGSALDDQPRRTGLARLTAAVAAAAATTARRTAAADVELGDEKVEKQFDDERRDVEQAVYAAAAE